MSRILFYRYIYSKRKRQEIYSEEPFNGRARNICSDRADATDVLPLKQISSIDATTDQRLCDAQVVRVGDLDVEDLTLDDMHALALHDEDLCSVGQD